MTGWMVGSIVFVCVFGCGVLGLLLRRFLADHHVNDDSMAIVKLGAGLMATLAALVLGLLVASAKLAFDRLNDDFTQTAGTVVMLDLTLADYGPQAKDARDSLRDAYASAVRTFFSDGDAAPIKAHAPGNLTRVEHFQQKVRDLKPQNDMQRLAQAEVVLQSRDLARARWLVIQPGQGSIPGPFLTILVLWLSVLFGGFGVVSVNSRTAIATLFVCALSVSGAIFLIEDIAHPLEGMMTIARDPADMALEQLGR
ncbi:MAG TPA: hypothetical protein VL522_17930 [Bordetella sp.]|jgi:hypothetical protein|nr:hypothetical protein [Bordetella sp.]